MATEPLQCKTLVLRVSIHCEGCKKKVKKVLQSVDGVYRCDIDARSNKVTVAVTGNVSADALLKRLRRSGKNAQQWPEQQLAVGTQRPGETKNDSIQPDKPGGTGTAHKPASGDAETSAAGQSNSKATPEEDPNKVARETVRPAQDDTESTNADAGGVDDVSHRSKEPTAEQCNGPQRKRKQLRPEEEKPVDAIATVVVAAASDQGSHTCHSPPHLQPPPPPPSVHVLSYSMARPSASAAYYAAAPATAAPDARSLPPQELPYTYPPCCYYSQPSPWAPQTGAASPARYSYADLFSDDNANSCTVM
ncbi:hypothetical protein CFC21_002418 [Triticum aestivum]|uniref:HMA domain-containing protein n=2 Tax=Triticum TaxID=4564 RepID=A0A9R0QA16_TRITD|nr:heavy metal-associated isoprenylated plant protein 35-like [Triticum dicoccoides]XP_044415653.1 heavy metal-associated isoprenylated plant protein 35-like isoform X1 [Triticum aestivum]KAF6984393.1 hypothetical protein CFC21_002418 [Triticum aestivum]VAH06733.1 unnamed protein product [Triticum turgidum subsp. durum]